MVLHSPITPWEYRHVRASAKKVLFDLVQETLCELLERSERIGCTLVIENIQDIDPALQLELVRSAEFSRCPRQRRRGSRLLYAHDG